MPTKIPSVFYLSSSKNMVQKGKMPTKIPSVFHLSSNKNKPQPRKNIVQHLNLIFNSTLHTVHLHTILACITHDFSKKQYIQGIWTLRKTKQHIILTKTIHTGHLKLGKTKQHTTLAKPIHTGHLNFQKDKTTNNFNKNNTYRASELWEKTKQQIILTKTIHTGHLKLGKTKQHILLAKTIHTGHLKLEKTKQHILLAKTIHTGHQKLEKTKRQIILTADRAHRTLQPRRYQPNNIYDADNSVTSIITTWQKEVLTWR